MKKYLLVFVIVLIQNSLAISQNIKATNSDKQKPMYMLSYDHGGLILWGGDHFRERLKNAMDWLDKYPGLKMGLDNEAHMYDKLARENPALLNEITNSLEKYSGRFGIGTCTYGQPLSQFVGEESNIRQISYALESVKKHFGYTPKIYVMSEHGMHSQIPQIIKGLGFEGAIMRTHFMMYGYNPTYNEPFGWWIGMDGSRIPTVPTYDGEGAEFFKTTLDNWIMTRYPSDDCRISFQAFRDTFSHINPLLASRFDDSGLRKEELVIEYDGNPLYRWILLDELLDLYQEPNAEFNPKPDDFTVRMPWGYCGNKIWNTSRKAEIKVLTAERLAAFEYIFVGNNKEDELHKSWENLLVAQHHDVQIVGLTNDAENYLSASLKFSEKVVEESMVSISKHMSAEGVQQVTVFNPVSWEQTQWIETKVSFEKGQANSIEIFMDEKKVPSSYLQNHYYSDGSIFESHIVFAADLPALSITSFSVVPVKESVPEFSGDLSVDQKNLKISSPYYTIILDKSGGIASMVDAKNQPIFEEGKRSAFFCGVIEGKEIESSGKWIISKTNGQSPWVTATEYGFISDIPYTFKMVFYSNSPRIDCSVDFNFDGQQIGQLSDNKRDRTSAFIHEKKLRFKCFPDLSGNVTGIKDLPFVVTETDNRYVEGNYWTAVAGQNQGLAYFNKGNMGSVREEDGGFSIPLSYAMYYIWGTRMLKGEYTYDFALFPFSGNWKNNGLHREAIAYNFPAVFTSGPIGDGTLGNQLNLIGIDSEKVLLSALYVEDSKVVARMYESSGSITDVSVSLQLKKYKLEETDLLGNIKRLTANTVNFNPWEIKTFQIQK